MIALSSAALLVLAALIVGACLGYCHREIRTDLHRERGKWL